MAGAVDRITEAGAVLAGGHTTSDEEPKFGLSVVGMVHPDRCWKNVGARPGDVMVLTKPIGSGVLFNANLKGLVSDEAMAECIATLITLNKRAAEVLHGFDVHAVTDVTGFGLAGHAMEMAHGSGITMTIETEHVPLMREALAMYERGVKTGANLGNREMVQQRTLFANVAPWKLEIWFDPQTSGGLLAALPAEQAEEAVAALVTAGVTQACRIGVVAPFDGSHSLIFA